MSNFLINLARRGAGLPAGQTDARPSVRENQASFENLEQEQIVETTEPAAFETGWQPAFETTPAVRVQTSEAQVPQGVRVQTSQAQVLQGVLTPAPASLIQRSKEAINQTANPLSVTRYESPAPSAVDQHYASEASTSSPKVVREFHSPINEGPSSSSATTQPLIENVVVAIPRASADGQSRLIDSPGSREQARTILSDESQKLQIVTPAETPENTPQGERDQLGFVTLTPRLLPIENQRLTKWSNLAPAAAEVAPMPIHVRIGKVEVRAAPPTVPPSIQRGGPAPTGFGSYHRLRTYRS